PAPALGQLELTLGWRLRADAEGNDRDAQLGKHRLGIFPVHLGMNVVRAAEKSVIELGIVALDVTRPYLRDIAHGKHVELQQLQRAVEDEGVADIVVVLDAVGEVRVPADAIAIVNFARRADDEDPRQAHLRAGGTREPDAAVHRIGRHHLSRNDKARLIAGEVTCKESSSSPKMEPEKDRENLAHL